MAKKTKKHLHSNLKINKFWRSNKQKKSFWNMMLNVSIILLTFAIFIVAIWLVIIVVRMFV